MELKERIHFTFFFSPPSLGSSWVFPRISHSHGLVYFGITSILLASPWGGGLQRQPDPFHPQPMRCRLPAPVSTVLCIGQ